MIYKVTTTGHRGELDVMYMDERTLKSMSPESIADIEEVKPKSVPPNEDGDWSYHQRIY